MNPRLENMSFGPTYWQVILQHLDVYSYIFHEEISVLGLDDYWNAYTTRCLTITMNTEPGI